MSRMKLFIGIGLLAILAISIFIVGDVTAKHVGGVLVMDSVKP